MSLKESFAEFVCPLQTLRISSDVLKVFNRHRQEAGSRESGGILLGYVYDDYDEIIKVTTPNRMDLRGLFSFIRSKIPAQLQINTSWAKSGGSLIFLGEWHTHSEINPKPSTVDSNMIEQVLRETVMEIGHLYLVIVGLQDTLWVGLQNSDGLTKLTVGRDLV